MERLAKPKIANLVLALVLGCTWGCASARPAVRAGLGSSTEVAAPREVTDSTFPKFTYQLLLEGHSPAEHRILLASVVRFQVGRAERAFAEGRAEAALSALDGALQLVRRNEFQTDMIEGHSQALSEAATATSRKGKAGEALAFYTMLRSLVPTDTALTADVKAHLAALREWSLSDKALGPLAWRGAQHRTLSQLALLHPTQQNFDRATSATREWILQGLKTDFTGPKSAELDRDEAVESYRAIKTGGIAAAGLFLRDGDAKGALAFVQRYDLVRLIPPAFQERLEAAAVEESPEAWASLYQFFSAAQASEQPELALDGSLAAGAAWGAALALHRIAPGSFAAAGPLCEELLGHGLGEVVPLIVSDTLSDDASPQDVSTAMAFIWRALSNAGETTSPAAARRILAASKGVLSQAEQLQGRVRPSAAMLHYVMGSLEKRWGELDAARLEFQSAARIEASVEALTALADIDRQRGAPKTALGSLEQARVFAQKSGNLVVQTETLLRSFDILSAIGDTREAEKVLKLGLKAALDATRVTGSETARVHSELLLARILESYGNRDGAHRATERAWEAAQSSVQNVTMTLLDAARRALTQRDLVAAREATRRAIDAKLADEDLIYVALWLRILERDLAVTSDGSVEEALAVMSESNSWPGQLRAWARGKLSLDDLTKAASGPIEQTEALFYATLARRGSVPPADTQGALQKVAESVAIELVEVSLARDLLAEMQGRHLKFTLPTDVSLP